MGPDIGDTFNEIRNQESNSPGNFCIIVLVLGQKMV